MLLKSTVWFSESDLLSMGRILQEGGGAGGAEKRMNDQGLNISHSPAFHACVLAPPLNGTNGLSHLFHRTTSLEEKTRRGNNVELFFFMVQYVLGRRHIHCGGGARSPAFHLWKRTSSSEQASREMKTVRPTEILGPSGGRGAQTGLITASRCVHVCVCVCRLRLGEAPWLTLINGLVRGALLSRLTGFFRSQVKTRNLLSCQGMKTRGFVKKFIILFCFYI